MRAFLAVAVAPPALAVVGDMMTTLREEAPDVRWVRPETVHITLHFFAGLPDGDVDTVVGAVTPAVQGIAPFAVRLDGYGSFPARGAPRVLWLGVEEGAADLARLAAQCESALAASGFATEDRPFRAHCTLGRPRGRWSGVQRRAFEQSQVPRFPPFTADHITLFESVPGRAGSTYIVRETVRLGTAER